MTNYTFFSLVAGGVLLFEIVSLQFSFSMTAHSYGITALRAEFALPARVQRALPALFTTAKSSVPDTVMFTGDVLLARNVEYLMNQKGSDYPFQGIDFSQFETNSYLVGNFESAIPNVHLPTEAGQMRFSVNPAHVPAAKQAGFTHFSLANNHTLDYGSSGYQNTWQTLINNEIKPVGDPRGLSQQSVTILDTESQKVALVAVELLQSVPSEAEVRALMQYANSVSDMQILYVHWGDEYILTNNKTQRFFAELFIANGIDLIVGHHPHVVQNVERIDGILVFYSLGNFIFDQYDTSDTQESLVLKLNLGRTATIDLLPVTSENQLSQPELMTPKNHAKFLASLANRSDSSLHSFIEAGRLPLHSLVASSTKMAMIN